MSEDFDYRFIGPNISTYILNAPMDFSSPQKLSDHYKDLAVKIAKDFSKKTKSVNLEQRLYVQGTDVSLDYLRHGLKAAESNYHTGNKWGLELNSLVDILGGIIVGGLAGGVAGFKMGYDVPSTILYTGLGVFGGGFVGAAGTGMALSIQNGIVEIREQKKDALFEPLRKALQI